MNSKNKYNNDVIKTAFEIFDLGSSSEWVDITIYDDGPFAVSLDGDFTSEDLRNLIDALEYIKKHI